MQKLYRNLILCAAVVACFGILAVAQDESPSLGDVARQARQQKQQDQTAQGKTGQAAKKPKVITDEQVAHSWPGDQPSSTSAAEQADGDSPADSHKPTPEEWKSKIDAQRQSVNDLQDNIDKLNKSIQFAPGNCVAGCVQWNEHQKEKQQEVERMQNELKEQQKKLDDLQEGARQEDLGSAVTD